MQRFKYFLLVLLLGIAWPGGPARLHADESGEDAWSFSKSGLREVLERIWIPKSRLKDGPHVKSAFRDTVAAARQSAIEVRAGDDVVAMGGIVGQDGWVLTKASLLDGDVTCRLDDGRELDARLVGVDRQYDLAMLKIDAKRLPVLEFERDEASKVGEWVATVGMDRDPLAIGIVSVPARVIAHRPGILGVRLDRSELGPRVIQVFDDTGAAEAGLLVNDVILSINGERVETREHLQRLIRRHSPGEKIEVGIRRGEDESKVTAMLTGRFFDREAAMRLFQNSLGGELSKRRFGFPSAFQHDTVLGPADCGGPLVNLDGEVVGFNIARAGRTESYAIPSHVVVTLLYDLMSGNQAPTPE